MIAIQFPDPGSQFRIGVVARKEKLENSNMDQDQIELQCKNCGRTFVMFLKQMAEHNARVIFPGCGAAGEYPLEKVRKSPAEKG